MGMHRWFKKAPNLSKLFFWEGDKCKQTAQEFVLYIAVTKKRYGCGHNFWLHSQAHFDMIEGDTMTGGLQGMDDTPFDIKWTKPSWKTWKKACSCRPCLSRKTWIILKSAGVEKSQNTNTKNLWSTSGKTICASNEDAERITPSWYSYSEIRTSRKCNS